jgi:SAM-dependent methyltransferase
MEWFENEDFWRDFYPHMFDERRFANAAAELDCVLAIAGVQPGAALDLCCGPARHSIPLAEKGFRVTGVDRSPFFLRKASERRVSRSNSSKPTCESLFAKALSTWH